jgi:hypothetical protein
MLPVLGFIMGVLVLSLFFGAIAWWMGSAQRSRSVYDAQTREAAALLKFVKPKVDKLRALETKVTKSDGATPDAALLEDLARIDYAVKPEELVTIAGGKLLVGAQQTDLLVKFTADTRLLASMSRDHVRMATKVDKKELEELASSETLSGRGAYAIIFNADEYTKNLSAKKPGPPIRGAIAIVESEPEMRDNEPWIKIRYPSSGRISETPLRSIVHVDRNQIVRSSGPNALGRYKRRHSAIRGKLIEINKYADTMVSQLEKLSTRPSAPILTFSK